MNCNEAKPLLYDRALEGTPNKDLDHHLETCTACRADLTDLELTRKLMRQGLPEEEPPRRIAFVNGCATSPTAHLLIWRSRGS